MANQYTTQKRRRGRPVGGGQMSAGGQVRIIFNGTIPRAQLRQFSTWLGNMQIDQLQIGQVHGAAKVMGLQGGVTNLQRTA